MLHFFDIPLLTKEVISMPNLITKHIFLSLAMITSFAMADAASYNWNNNGTDITDSSNWNGTSPPPQAGDDGYFSTSATPTSPTLSASSNANTFTIDKIEMTSSFPSTSYTFNIQDPGSIFNFVGNNYPTGFVNDTSVVQTFNIFNQGQLFFKGISSSDTRNSGLVVYNVGDHNSSGFVTFQDNTQGGRAQINVRHSSTITYNDNSEGGQDSVLAYESSVINFNANTSADKLAIMLGDTLTPGFLNFNDSSGAGGGGTITANGNSIINFNDNSHADVAFMALSKSTLNFNDNATAALAGNVHISPPLTADQDSIINFNDFSTANVSGFLLGNSSDHSSAKLRFNNNARADLATITAIEDSVVVFNGHSTASSAVLHMQDRSTLLFKETSDSSVAVITLDNQAFAYFSQTADQYLTAKLSGTGTLIKTGLNTLDVIVDTSSFHGQTIIQGGNFALNERWGGDITVQSEGRISGNGIILQNLTVDGTVSPGNSIGHLTVQGNYLQGANSIYQVDVTTDQGGQADFIGVSGSATLDSGSGVLLISDAVQLPPNQSFDTTILHADGGVNGAYTVLTTNNPLITASLSYDDKNVFLIFQNTLALIPQTHNQRVVSTQLQTLNNPTAEEDAVLVELVGLSTDAARFAMDQMSAEQYTLLLPSVEILNRQFLRRLYDPLRSKMLQPGCLNQDCFSDNCQDNDCNTTCNAPFEFWSDASYNRCLFDGSHQAKGAKIHGYEFTLGAQMSTPCDWTFGVAASYAKEQSHYNLGGDNDNHCGLGAIYALYRPCNFYCLGDLLFSYSQMNIHRPIDIGDNHFKKQGNPRVYQGTLYVETGKDLKCLFQDFLVQPFVGLELDFAQLDAFSEHSSDHFLNIDMSQKSRGSAFSRLGFHLSTSCFNRLTFSADAAWQYRLTACNNQLEANFRTFGDEFVLEGLSLSRNSIDATLNAAVQLCQGLSLYTKGNLQSWSNAYSYTILGGLQASW